MIIKHGKTSTSYNKKYLLPNSRVGTPPPHTFLGELGLSLQNFKAAFRVMGKFIVDLKKMLTMICRLFMDCQATFRDY
jgi:hypothetical protein